MIQRELVQPLTAAEKRRSKFSRARQPPMARRVRVLQAQPSADPQGRTFFTFAIDDRYGIDELELDETPDESGWTQNALKGCVYAESGEVFIQRGGKYLAAAVLLGKRSPAPAEHICRADPGELAQRP